MPIKVFASGQSNMEGHGFGGPALTGVSQSVTVWNSSNPAGTIGNAFVSSEEAQAAGAFFKTDRNNLAVWFCDRMARKQQDAVTLTISPRGGSPISMWHPGELTNPMLPRSISMWAATGQEPADVFLWHQGEANIVATASDYHSAFLDLLDNLEDGGVISSSTAVVVGGIFENGSSRVTFNRSVLMGLTKKSRKIAYAPSHDLPAHDNLHFTGPSLYELGSYRYYSAYLYARR